MRLIDADELIMTIDCSADLGGALYEPVRSIKAYAIHMVESRRTVDAVEVVRCADCEEWERSMVMHGRGVCAEWSDYDNGRIRLTEGNDYCSYGERRSDG